ncbi:T-box transcription factor TBX22-like isoform X1 [Haliotis rufescens]|uniref:T-box transcription factor TBX22-like isoform X1 n=1 Tax=Haliotis rufescens TaxID=6454 RepID=UPI001EB092CF|nr:T-box transcription factor TBX22-like isoform X1 [Haliotis rufescens]
MLFVHSQFGQATMLSAKARAFSVEQLLGKPDNQTDIPRSGGRHCLQEACAADFGQFRKTVHDESGRHEVQVELCHGELWRAFHRLGTEMIITKSGRRMFPAVRVRILGVREDMAYRVSLDFQALDNHKYRYVYHSSKWMVAGTGDPPPADQRYSHPDCPLGGRHLINQVISFEKLKLTNRDDPQEGQISLVSMQKYTPRIHVYLLNPHLEVQAHFVTSFPQTAFMAVTAYQNQEITRLKIARNPFAKGFRESDKSRTSLEAVMSSLCSYMILRKNDTSSRKRCLPKEASDLPKKIFKPMPTRVVHTTTTDHSLHAQPSTNHFHVQCVPVSIYGVSACCYSLSRDDEMKEPAKSVCDVCSSFPYWKHPTLQYPGVYEPYSYQQTFPDYQADIKPDSKADIKHVLKIDT